MQNCVATPKNPSTNTVYFINPITNKKVKFKTNELPFSNNFKQMFVLEYEVEDVVLVVRCLQNSQEPGREYYISYNMQTQKFTGCATRN